MYVTVSIVELVITLFITGAVTSMLLLAVYDWWNHKD